MKVFGPYKRKDDRSHVIIIDGKKRRTVSYPKYIMEQHLGRILDKNETVHHTDGDFTNNDLSNLEIIDRKTHIIQDVIRVEKVKVKCIWCKIEMVRRAADIDWNSKQGCAGPFCKSCAGVYGTMIQNGLIKKKLKAQKRIPKSERKYYKRPSGGNGRPRDLKSRASHDASRFESGLGHTTKRFSRPIKRYPR